MNQSNEAVTNAPEKIYLQMGDFIPPADFSDFTEVTWCKDRIDENDIEYVLAERASDAVAFGEWILNNQFRIAVDYYHVHTWNNGNDQNPTTQELYQMFKERK